MAKNEVVPQINEVNRITGGTELRGTLITVSDIRIDGFFEGKIQSKGKVVIGENAQFIGDLFCGSADIWGKMEGNLVTGNMAGFKSKAHFNGALQCQRIFIEDGALFTGTCRIITEDDYNQMVEKYNSSAKSQK